MDSLNNRDPDLESPESERDSHQYYIDNASNPGGNSRKSYIVFSLLLVATVFTTYFAGGFSFSLSLLLILGSHEFGHYYASRKNGVNATLPFFIPAPPPLLFGTFGAFIQIRDPIPDRRVLMEIGSAGPIAGFIVTLPVLFIGLSLSDIVLPTNVGGLAFGNSLLLQLFSIMTLGVSPSSTEVDILFHPMAMAGWIGLLITALNLLPIGQLDGGHIIYSLYKDKHSILAKVFFLALFPLGFFWYGWWFWAFLITLFGFKHPPLDDEELDLSPRHKALGYISILIFAVSFIPVPFKVIELIRI